HRRRDVMCRFAVLAMASIAFIGASHAQTPPAGAPGGTSAATSAAPDPPARAAGTAAPSAAEAPPPGSATPPPAPLPAAPTKIADNVYVFRYGFHQAMFVVTPAGVVATDPIAYLRPEAAVAYLAEIRKVSDAPIRYLVYSHHHYDHIAGGKPFRDA